MDSLLEKEMKMEITHNKNPKIISILLAILVIFTFLFYSGINAGISTTHNIVHQSTIVGSIKHSVEGHALEYSDTFDCFQKNGSSYSYSVIEHKEDRNVFLCEDDDEWFALITKRGYKGKGWWENEDFYEFRNAFKLDRYESVDDYIQEELITKRNATISRNHLSPNELRFESKLPWEIP